MSRDFRRTDRETPWLLPPSLQDWLPEGHLARFVVDIVEQLDLSDLTSDYSRGGKRAYHPAMLLSLLFYGYATGVFSRAASWSGRRMIPFQIHNHPRCAFQAAAALTIAQSRLMMDVMRAGCSEKYVHAWSTALRASSTVGKSLFARKFDFK